MRRSKIQSVARSTVVAGALAALTAFAQGAAPAAPPKADPAKPAAPAAAKADPAAKPAAAQPAPAAAAAAPAVPAAMAQHPELQIQPADNTAKPAPIAYPKDYRSWTHVKSMVIYSTKHPLHGSFAGIHHVYANPKAMSAMKAKKEYGNGSVLVFDLLETDDAQGAYSEGKRKFLAVMVKDSKKHANTLGWGWQVFEGGDAAKPVINTVAAAKACATCHTEVGAKGWAFSEYRN